MRRHLVSAVCGTLLLVACGAQSTCGGHQATGKLAGSSGACGHSQAAHHAFLVVEHMSGASMQAMVTFASDSVSGKELMDCSGVSYRLAHSGTATVVCQIDREPANSTACALHGQPHWALFVFSSGHWSQPGIGFAGVRLHDREAMGWHYVPAAAGMLVPPPLPSIS